MKYKPLHSNFEDMQDDIVQDVLSVGNKIEDIKDMVAKQIDEYVEAILKEHVEECSVSLWMGEDDVLTVNFSAGEKKTQNTVDMFAQEVSLLKLMDEFCWWGELSDYEPDVIRKTAAKIADFALRLQKRADEIQKENEEFDRQWKERLQNEKETDR